MKRNLIMACAAATMLTACGGDVGKVLGLKKEAPDEFTVVRRAPLSLPPNFGLRPPEPGAKRAQETSARDDARSAVYATRQAQKQREKELKASEDAALLTAVGASDADPDIRKVIAEETNQIIRESESFVDDVMFWKDKEEPGVIVDASEETRRIQENIALGRDVTDGDTPMIRREKDSGLLRNLNWPF